MTTLTRYLYSKDEVQYSLIYTILEKINFKECLFWFSELYYSKYENECWNLLFEVYYNFYAIKNPKLERIFIKLYNKWKTDKSIKNCLHVLKNLFFNSNKNDLCYKYFKLIGTQTIQPKSYRGRPPSILKKLTIEKKYKNLIVSIHKKHYANMIYNLYRFRNEQQKIYNLIIEYFNNNTNISLKKCSFKTILDNPYQNKLHIIMCLVLYLHIDEAEINKNNIYILISDEEMNYVQDTEKKPERIYKTLKENRLFQIRKEIGCFSLKRYDCLPMNKILWDHWEYYAYKCPLWKERFNRAKIKLDHIHKKIQFVNEEEEEIFYKAYNYEPDEQNLNTQEKSTLCIEKIETDCYTNILSNHG